MDDQRLFLSINHWLQVHTITLHVIGVANSKIETLRDGETNDFLCETKTFPLFKLWDREIWDFWTLRKKSRLRDLKSAEKTRLRKAAWVYNFKEEFTTIKYWECFWKKISKRNLGGVCTLLMDRPWLYDMLSSIVNTYLHNVLPLTELVSFKTISGGS